MSIGEDVKCGGATDGVKCKYLHGGIDTRRGALSTLPMENLKGTTLG